LGPSDLVAPPAKAGLLAQLRRFLVGGADAVSRRFAYGRTVITLESGTLSFDDYQHRPQPRFGVTTPALPWLVSRLQEQSDHLAMSLDICLAFAADLARIPMTAPEQSTEPRWLNPWMSGLDGAWLYSIVRNRAPALFVEIGSGNSTKFVRRGIDDGNLGTRIVSIDPYPRADIDRLCDTVHRKSLETADFAVFEQLTAGDILFFDGSHRALQNSDVTVFFLEILPRLPHGVLIGIHDIFLPFDYPLEWTSRIYNEQYMLAAYLLGRQDITFEFAAYWMGQTERFNTPIKALFGFDSAEEVQRHGGCFFFLN
jgi:hypothetical protein